MSANRPGRFLLALSLFLASSANRTTADPRQPTRVPPSDGKPPPVVIVEGLNATNLTAGGKTRPIPQDPERQRRQFHDKLAWNLETLGGAYDKVGKQDARWDKPAREALDLAARFFSRSVDPSRKFEEIYTAARQAVDAGCTDPLVLHIYARASYAPNYPGPEELERRFTRAAIAIENSAYPPFRRAIALDKAAVAILRRQVQSAENRKDAARFLDAVVGLLVKSAWEDRRTSDLERLWFDLAWSAVQGYRRLDGDLKAAFSRVDKQMVGVPAFKSLRLQIQAQYLIREGWDARGHGPAQSVTEDGWKTFNERHDEARKALEQAYKVNPDDPRTATLMLSIEQATGGDRAEMEKWFERAMKADGNNREACEAKLLWLEPKWHGNSKEVLAFGRACRDTKNWQVGITLLVADAHYATVSHLPTNQQAGYFHTTWIRDEIKAVFEEYLKHYPGDYTERSSYAVYCVLSGRYADAHEHFRIVGDNLSWNHRFSEEWVKQLRAFVAEKAKARAK